MRFTTRATARLTAAAGVIAGITVAAGLPAQAVNQIENSAAIVSVLSEKCLTAQSLAEPNGAAIFQTGCGEMDGQTWRANPLGDGSFTIVSNQNETCVDVDKTTGGMEPGTRVFLWDCHNGANQQWDLAATSREHVYRLISRHNNLCLSIDPAHPEIDGTHVTVEVCSDSDAQRWTIPSV